MSFFQPQALSPLAARACGAASASHAARPPITAQSAAPRARARRGAGHELPHSTLHAQLRRPPPPLPQELRRDARPVNCSGRPAWSERSHLGRRPHPGRARPRGQGRCRGCPTERSLARGRRLLKLASELHALQHAPIPAQRLLLTTVPRLRREGGWSALRRKGRREERAASVAVRRRPPTLSHQELHAQT